jgi:hypothetical protein
MQNFKNESGKARWRSHLYLLITTGIIMPANAQTQSQVIQSAQRIYDELVNTYNRVSGYVNVLNSNLSYSRQTLDNANGYENIYDRVINFGSAGVSVAVAILSGGLSAAGAAAGEEAFGLFVDEMSKDMPKLALKDFMYGEAYKGIEQEQAAINYRPSLKKYGKTTGRFRTLILLLTSSPHIRALNLRQRL